MRKTDRMRQGLILAGPELAVKEKPARLTQAGWGDEIEGPLKGVAGVAEAFVAGAGAGPWCCYCPAVRPGAGY